MYAVFLVSRHVDERETEEFLSLQFEDNWDTKSFGFISLTTENAWTLGVQNPFGYIQLAECTAGHSGS